MTVLNVFHNLELENRLGQPLSLAVHRVLAFGREYVFVAALTHHASSLVAKNAEHFAFQLRKLFNSDTRRFEMIELRGDMKSPSLHRWRFEWVGASPITPRSESISSPAQQNQLLQLLTQRDLEQTA